MSVEDLGDIAGQRCNEHLGRRGHLAPARKIDYIKVCVCLHVDFTAQGLLQAAIDSSTHTV